MVEELKHNALRKVCGKKMPLVGVCRDFLVHDGLAIDCDAL